MNSRKVFAYTITRADTAYRAKLLLETITQGRETADYPFHWHVYVNGAGSLAEKMIESCAATRLIDSFEVAPFNEGQHPPTNRAIARVLEEGYDDLLRLDDDIEFLTKRWLAKLAEAGEKTGNRFILSPTVRGLRWQPPQSQKVEMEGIPLHFLDHLAPIGGICRLTPVQHLREKPYVSDVRLPLGGGDAAGVGRWQGEKEPYIFAAYCKHIRIRHAKSTDVQESEDPVHAKFHSIAQYIPFIPVWRP